jgi:hypothetical protein
MAVRILTVCIILSFFVYGCEQPAPQKTIEAAKCTANIESYGPASLEIVGLSELKAAGGDENAARLKVFVKVMDAFGSAIKTPCVIRVELYEYVTRSQSPLGKRLEIWPDIELTDSCKNNSQWRDYLRAYEFNLDVSSKLEVGRMYIIETTCASPMGKRLSAQYKISYQK